MTIKSVKKAFRNSILLLLTVGASLTLGLLSFSGMFVLWPILWLAGASAILAVAYEGEIYWQNLKGVFKTLFTPNALKKQMFREYLEKTITELVEKSEELELPAVLDDYIQLIQKLDEIDQHHALNQADKAYRKRLKQEIKRLEIEFAEQLYHLDKTQNEYSSLQQWFLKHGGLTFKTQYRMRYGLFSLAKGFSLAAGVCISAGTAYLLFDAFTIIPFLMAIPATLAPAMIIGLGGIAGLAYALITYNSITSMVNNQTIQRFLKVLRRKPGEALSFSHLLKLISATVFMGLTLFLTICTAGTWWTIGQNLASFLKPSVRAICTLILAASAFFTNCFNSICTWLDLREACTDPKAPDSASAGIKAFFKSAWHDYCESFSPLAKTDNALQRYNPFRLFIQVLLTPVNAVLFIAHVISIGVTGDQLPGCPASVSATLCAIDEFKEDYHRFAGHAHHHRKLSIPELLTHRATTGGGHEHSLNLPGRFIKFLLLPIYGLAIIWDWAASQKNPNPLSFSAAYQRQFGLAEPVETDSECKSIHSNMEALYGSPNTAQKSPPSDRSIHPGLLFAAANADPSDELSRSNQPSTP